MRKAIHRVRAQPHVGEEFCGGVTAAPAADAAMFDKTFGNDVSGSHARVQ